MNLYLLDFKIVIRTWIIVKYFMKKAIEDLFDAHDTTQ